MSPAIERVGFLREPRQKLIDRIQTFSEAIYVAQSESRWRVILPGEKRSASIDSERFGELPVHSEQGLHCLAGQSVRFLDNCVATDKFRQKHPLRRRWRDGLSRRMGFGFDLKNYFKSNRLSGNGITCMVAAANIAERRMTSVDPDLLSTHQMKQVMGAIHEIQAIPGDRFADRYIEMTNAQKMGVAKEISSMASEFLDIVNNPQARGV